MRKKVLPSEARQVLISSEVRKKVLPNEAKQVLIFYHIKNNPARGIISFSTPSLGKNQRILNSRSSNSF